MLRQLLDPTRWAMVVTAVEAQTEVLAARVADEKPALVCIGSLPPGGLAHTRYLCKRIRSRSPDVKIVVGRWGLSNDAKPNEEQLREAGADAMTTTLLQTRDQLNAWLPMLASDGVISSASDNRSLHQHAAIPSPFGGVPEEARRSVADLAGNVVDSAVTTTARRSAQLR
jgi:hypothetical protein